MIVNHNKVHLPQSDYYFLCTPNKQQSLFLTLHVVSVRVKLLCESQRFYLHRRHLPVGKNL